MTNGPGHVITDYGPTFIVWMTFAAPSVIAAVASLAAMARGRRNGEHAEAAAADAKAVREQVENSHTTNLRDDLDKITDRLADHGRVLQRVDDKASRIGEELRTETALRREADARTNGKVDKAVDWAREVIEKHHPEEDLP